MDLRSSKVSEVICPEAIDLALSGITSKEEVIAYLSDKLDEAGLLLDKKSYIESVYEREGMGSTYMGHFIAIPHGKSPAVREAGIAFGRSDEGFEYVSQMDRAPVKLVFLLAIPDRTSADAYMAILAKLARLLVHEEFREALMAAKTYEDVIAAIMDCEKLLIN